MQDKEEKDEDNRDDDEGTRRQKRGNGARCIMEARGEITVYPLVSPRQRVLGFPRLIGANLIRVFPSPAILPVLPGPVILRCVISTCWLGMFGEGGGGRGGGEEKGGRGREGWRTMMLWKKKKMEWKKTVE